MLSKLRVATSFLAFAVTVGGLAGVTGTAKANDELIKMQADPNQ